MSSPDAPATDDDLPPALSSMWRLCKLGYQHEPRLMVVRLRARRSLAALPDALLALWLKLLGDGVVDGDRALVRAGRRSASALSAVATWFLRTVSHAGAAPVPRQGDDRARVARRPAAGVGRDHRPPRAARATSTGCRCCATRSSCSTTCTCRCSRPRGWILLRLGVTVVLLASIHPALLLLGAVRPPDGRHVDAGGRRSSAAPRSAGAPDKRLARTSSPPPPPRRRARRCGSPASGPASSRSAGRRGSAGTARWPRPAGGRRVWHTLAWAVFGVAYVGAVVFVASGLDAPRRRRAARAGRRLAAVRLHRRDRRRDRVPARASGWTARSGWPGSRTTPPRSTADADLPVPDAAARAASRFEDVSFAYPGTDRLVLEDVVLTLPAGAVVAVVGENGAGKTTLVKLLAKLYEPTSGRILVDGVDLARMPADEWRDAAGRRLPGLLPLRAPRPPERRPRRRAPARRRAGGRGGGRPGRRRRRRRRGSTPGSTPSSARPGPTASRCASGSGRSSRWPAGSCATSRCCWCSTSRPRPSTPRPSTRCSSATPAGVRRDRGRRPHHDPRVAPVLHRAHGRPHRRARRRPRRRGRQPRRPHGRGGQYAELYDIQAAAYR